MSGGKILVTGGTGFIGRNFLRRLVGSGVKPSVLTRDATKLAEFAGVTDLFKVDLVHHGQTAAIIREIEPNTIVHLAGSISHGDDSFAVNFDATRSLLNSAVETGVSRFILLGTADEYGDQPTPFREGVEARPISAYARSKYEAGEFALNLKGLQAVVLRIFTAYGSGQPESMFLNQAIGHALLNKHFEMTDGTQRRDLVYIDDVVEAIMRAISAENIAGRKINIGTGRAIRLADAAKLIWDFCGADPDMLDIGGRPKLDGEGHDTEADITLADELLGWKPRVSFESGLQRTITQMKKIINDNG